MSNQHTNATTIPIEHELRAFHFDCLFINFGKDY